MKTSVPLAITGFALIAISYGLARFAWGLMLPAVARDIPFSPRLAGILSACSFAAYCCSIVLASLLSKRHGPRVAAAASALSAVAGLLVLAVSSSAVGLGIGLFVAGLSAGLASPSLAAAVSLAVDVRRQAQVNTIINAGTGAGIILSVPLLLLLPWRAACGVFAVLALLCLVPVLRSLPYRAQPQPEHHQARRFSHRLVRLALIAFFSGMVSAAWWSFGPQVLQQHVGVPGHLISMLWWVCGAASLFGALTGPLARVIGMRQVYRLALISMASPLWMMAFSQTFSGWLIPAVALCGFGYVTLSGVLLVGGAEGTPSAPASGVGVVFFMLAAGQVAGALAFGMLYAQAGVTLALNLFAVLAVIMMFFAPARGNPAA